MSFHRGTQTMLYNWATWVTDRGVWLMKERTKQAGKNAVRGKINKLHWVILSHMCNIKNPNETSFFTCVFVLPVKQCWCFFKVWTRLLLPQYAQTDLASFPSILVKFTVEKNNVICSNSANEEVAWQLHLWTTAFVNKGMCVGWPFYLIISQTFISLWFNSCAISP